MRYNLGLALAAQGDYGQAIEQLKQITADDPAYRQAASNLGVMYSTVGDFDAAIRIFADLLAQEPANPIFHFNLGVAYQGAGIKEKAAAEFQRGHRPGAGQQPPGAGRAA